LASIKILNHYYSYRSLSLFNMQVLTLRTVETESLVIVWTFNLEFLLSRMLHLLVLLRNHLKSRKIPHHIALRHLHLILNHRDKTILACRLLELPLNLFHKILLRIHLSIEIKLRWLKYLRFEIYLLGKLLLLLAAHLCRNRSLVIIFKYIRLRLLLISCLKIVHIWHHSWLLIRHLIMLRVIIVRHGKSLRGPGSLLL
jgi:hypothetical protein